MRTIGVLVILLFAGVAATAQHVPGDGAPYVAPGVDLQGHGRLFAGAGNLEAMFEYLLRYDADQRFYDLPDIALYDGFAAGLYYRIHPNLKLGAFYRMQLGARHDEDWINDGSDWLWRDTTDRIEHVFMGDATPRFQMTLFGSTSWVLSIKNRYEITTYTQDAERVILHSLLVRPGITYFWLRDREPILNLSLQYATYFSLNFGEKLWYQQGPYLSAIYHLLPGVTLGLNLGYQVSYWSESEDFDLAWPNNSYARPIYDRLTVDLGVIYKLRR
jgi:hypothetical protein